MLIYLLPPIAIFYALRRYMAAVAKWAASKDSGHRPDPP
jgi:hypothetical protein